MTQQSLSCHQLSDEDFVGVLSRAVELLGTQVAVANLLGVRRATICRILSGSYGAKLTKIKARARGKLSISCPINGALPFEECHNNYSMAEKGICPTDPQLRDLYQACIKCRGTKC